MNAESTLADLGRRIDWFWDAFTNAITSAAGDLRRAEDTIWRATRGGHAADTVGQYPAYRTAVMTIRQAATTDTRVEMQAALLHGRIKARAEVDYATLRLRQRLLLSPLPAGEDEAVCVHPIQAQETQP